MQLSPVVGKSKRWLALLNQLAEISVKSDREVCVYKMFYLLIFIYIYFLFIILLHFIFIIIVLEKQDFFYDMLLESISDLN